MELEALLVDFYGRLPRQGPGSDGETLRALDLARLDRSGELRVADIGCGTGASTMVLAQALAGRITAVDLFSPFLDKLTSRARELGLGDRIDTIAASMDELPWDDESFDLLWSEGAIYNIGFERGIREWRRFLKPGALLAVTELSWLVNERPAELEEYWNAEYPEIATAPVKLAQMERAGYLPLGHFVLPRECWTENYYTPMRAELEPFLAAYPDSDDARALVAEQRKEIELIEKYPGLYSYCFYIARKL